jgi:hypothetical protein
MFLSRGSQLIDVASKVFLEKTAAQLYLSFVRTEAVTKVDFGM